MGYINDSLSAGEEVVKVFKLHWSNWLGFWLLVIIVGPITLGIAWIYAIWLFFSLKGREYGVTNRRVIWKEGIISRTTEETKLDSVETVEIRQGIWARIFGAGSVKVTGKGGSPMMFKNVDDPMMVKKTIEGAMHS